MVFVTPSIAEVFTPFELNRGFRINAK